MRAAVRIGHRIHWGTLAAILLLCGGPLLAQEVSTADPVQRLAAALGTASSSVEDRAAALQERVEDLRSFDELRRALILRDWRDAGDDPALAIVDRKYREIIAGRIVQSLRQGLRHRDEGTQLEALRLMAGLDGAVCGPDGQPPARVLTADVLVLLHEGTGAVRLSAARTLGRVGPDAVSAAPGLGALLRDPDPGLRAAAAEGLTGIVGVATRRAAAGSDVPVTSAVREDAIRTACAVIPMAVLGLGDGQVVVRRRCVEVVGRSAALLAELVPTVTPLQDADGWPAYQQTIHDEFAAVAPLVAMFKAQGPWLARAAGDVDPEVRLLARKALAETAEARLRLIRRSSSVLAAPERLAVAKCQEQALTFLRDDPLMQGLRETIPALTAGVDDADIRVRRATLDVLEAMGQGAVPAIPALVHALSDRDRFVRWAAARALGMVHPLRPETVVPSLTALLSDGDPNLRMTAAASLREYGPQARTAVPALLTMSRSNDAEQRAAAIRTLESVGSDDASALAVLNAALNDTDARVRQLAEQALGRVGSSHEAINALLRPATTQPDPKTVGSLGPKRD
jgi:HEAT repeat protein